MVEIAHLGAVVEEHAVALPVEAVGEQHLALGAEGHPVNLHGRLHAVADAEVDLTVVGLRGAWGFQIGTTTVCPISLGRGTIVATTSREVAPGEPRTPPVGSDPL